MRAILILRRGPGPQKPASPRAQKGVNNFSHFGTLSNHELSAKRKEKSKNQKGTVQKKIRGKK